ncbi:hypothetical protein ElyMa_004200900 [Elysia marginata]|uniref:Uncharacterized protein n=1 Tax=Elysia marginata TaxID=1093978 RepID=A0AAV4GM37_9GAST|nr:hypothetical protein ElyMa_004200900 [Elysia marginata]
MDVRRRKSLPVVVMITDPGASGRCKGDNHRYRTSILMALLLPLVNYVVDGHSADATDDAAYTDGDDDDNDDEIDDNDDSKI